MGTYYDDLGVPPDATPDELRRAYRARARQAHPDVHGDPDVMRRLNEAWRVLGDAEARRRYDRRLGMGHEEREGADGARQPGPRRPGTAGDEHGDDAFGHPRPRPARPVLIAVALAVLAAIFVVTAYAGGPSRTGVPRGSPVGRCLDRQPGVDAFVSCRQPNDGEVVDEVDDPDDCPPPTRAHRVLGRDQVVCLALR